MSKFLYWLIGALFAIVMTLVGWVQVTTQNRMAAIEIRQNSQDTIAASRGERLAVLETMAKQNTQDHTEIKQLLRDMDSKLDEVKRAIR